ncbi:MAG: hypothetical protein IPG59_03935 [Candidatus Melainabacteria bacterium]|nr:MAG: hypothetical protein IPG59_03935 [Candidatus Melainabacteria bacterium]
MFERFTEKAIKVIMLAQEESRRMGHNFVGTEQLLLGLIGEGTGIAARVMKKDGVNLKSARVEVEKIIGRGSGFVAVEIPFTPRCKRVLELSWQESRKFHNNFIGTEHLLLGLLEENGGVAIRVLEALMVDLKSLRNAVEQAVSGNSQSYSLAEKILSSCDSVSSAMQTINHELLKLHDESQALCKRSDISKVDAEAFQKELLEKLKNIEKMSKSVCVPEVFDFTNEITTIDEWIETLK